VQHVRRHDMLLHLARRRRDKKRVGLALHRCEFLRTAICPNFYSDLVRAVVHP
jgi:hypothetical protein